MAIKPIPEGYHTITQFATVSDARKFIDFVKQAFEAHEIDFHDFGGGHVHGEIRIGDSIMMVGQSAPSPQAFHLYVPDADAAYDRAVRAGATSRYAPCDQDYGDREAFVSDAWGNSWYVATHKSGTGHIPENLHTVNTYLHPKGTDKLIEFLKQAFGVQEIIRVQPPGKPVEHAKIRIGDSVIEMGEAHGEFQPMPANTYLYVEDADATFHRAIAAGATTIDPPADRPWGDRNAMARDPWDNIWCISTHKQDVTAAEMERRMKAAG